MPQVQNITDGRFEYDLSLPVQRVSLADLNDREWHRWLLGRVSDCWPHISLGAARTHMAAWINANDHRFMKCGNATMLAMVWHDPLDRQPKISVVFMFLQNKDGTAWKRESVRLFREVQIWAANMGASRVDVGPLVDVTPRWLTEIAGAKERSELWLEARRNEDRIAPAA